MIFLLSYFMNNYDPIIIKSCFFVLGYHVFAAFSLIVSFASIAYNQIIRSNGLMHVFRLLKTD